MAGQFELIFDIKSHQTTHLAIRNNKPPKIAAQLNYRALLNIVFFEYLNLPRKYL